MKEIISIFVVLIILFLGIGLMPVCEDRDIFAIDMKEVNANSKTDSAEHAYRREKTEKKEDDMKIVTIAKIREDAKFYDSKQVSLKVKEGIRPGDGSSVEQLSTRSDCYVHDGTGTMVLRGGWQYKNAYVQSVKNDPEYVFIDENIKIEDGVWEISPFVYSRYGKTILSLRKFD